MRAAFFLVGPTASGKTEIAQLLAERMDCDILSADSMLIYAGMDIGTAKPTPAQRSRVRYDGLDLVSPDRSFDVCQYLQHCQGVFNRLEGSGRNAIVVGGTGLYIAGLMRGMPDAPGPQAGEREQWNRLLLEKGLPYLQEELRKRAPNAYTSLQDPDNPRRVIRALEIAGCTDAGAPPRRPQTVPRTIVVGLEVSAQELRARIEQRVRRMFAQGLVEELRGLMQQYGELSRTALQAIGYAEALEIVSGHSSNEEAMRQTVSRTVRLAKRQRTWFRHQVVVDWVSAGGDTRVEDVAERVMARWRVYGPTEVAV